MTKILGKSVATAKQMSEYLLSVNKNPLLSINISALDFCQLYIDICAKEGVRGDVAFAQACKETGHFKYGNDVKYTQNNFAGIGATGGVPGCSFSTIEIGILAQAQHLKSYATKAMLNEPCVDPRRTTWFMSVKGGTSPNVETLSGTWAVPGYNTKIYKSLKEANKAKDSYGYNIVNILNDILKVKTVLTNSKDDEKIDDNKGGNKMATITKDFLLSQINGIVINKAYLANSRNFLNKSSRDVKFIVMHYTGNRDDSALNNAKYFKNNAVGSSAHFFVDETSIYQTVELRDVAYHCGTTKGYKTACRNSNSFGIEMTTAGNYLVSEQTQINSAYLCAELCKLIGITASTVDTYVLRHYDVGKNNKSCPKQYVTNASEWLQFKTWVKNILKTGKHSSGSTTSNPSVNTTPTVTVSTSKGNSIVEKGQKHAIEFTGVKIQVDGLVGAETRKMKARVLQHALNLDYGNSIAEDGAFGTKSKIKLGSHYVKKGEKQYMVTAAEILMELNGIDPNGVEMPGKYGNGLVSASKKYFGDDGLKITASEFLKLIR